MSIGFTTVVGNMGTELPHRTNQMNVLLWVVAAESAEKGYTYTVVNDAKRWTL
jgi:hypothetical protein